MHHTLSFCAALGLASAALGQSMNIDFGSSASTPPSSFAASGAPGVWNSIDLLLEGQKHSDPIPLVDLNGNPTPCTMVVSVAYGTLDYPHAEISGDFTALMNDALFSLSPDIAMHITIKSLEPGDYRIIIYAWDYPTDSFGVAAFLGGSPLFPGSCGGPWTGQPTVGVTTLAQTSFINGTAAFEVVGAGPGSFFNGSGVINGLQLLKVGPAPCDPDFNNSGTVDGADLGLLLASWGGRGHADLDGSGLVDGADLGLLLAAWGDCPTIDPFDCGVQLARGRGRQGAPSDCLVVHPAPGCGEPECCDGVCTIDSTCCSLAWDQICVDIANLTAACSGGIYPKCGNPASGSCFTFNDSLPGCEDADCCDTICDIDSYCCAFTWDSFCADAASAICGES